MAKVADAKEIPGEAIEQVRRKRANGKTTFKELIESAIAVWGEGGINAVSMNAVAARAGRTRGTMYHHFADRDALLLAVRSHLDEAFAELFEHGELYRDNAYEAFARFAADNPELVCFYLRSLLDRRLPDDPLIRAGRSFQRALAEAGKLKEGVDVDHVAYVTIGMWFAATLAVSEGKSAKDRRTHGRRFAGTFEHMMTSAFINDAPSAS